MAISKINEIHLPVNQGETPCKSIKDPTDLSTDEKIRSIERKARREKKETAFRFLPSLNLAAEKADLLQKIAKIVTFSQAAS